MIARAYIDNYVAALAGISDAGKQALAGALSEIVKNPDKTRAINDSVRIMRTICGGSSQDASRLAAEFYRGLRAAEIENSDYEPIDDSPFNQDANEAAMRAFAKSLTDGNEKAFIAKAQNRLGYEVTRSAGETLFKNGMADPIKPRFARIPRGSKSYPDGCPFCQMLASRGFVYLSARSAGELAHYHDGCSCAIVPSWGAGAEGYDPSAYDEGYADWKARNHTQHDANVKRSRRNRYKDGRLRAGYDGLRVDQKSSLTKADRERIHRENVKRQHEGWIRAYEKKHKPDEN